MSEPILSKPKPCLYYVTVRDGGRSGFLLGPYDTHHEALANVERGRGLASQANVWSHFYAYGTASLPASARQPKTVFGREEVAHV